MEQISRKLVVLRDFPGGSYVGRLLPQKKEVSQKKKTDLKKWVPGKGSRSAVFISHSQFEYISSDLLMNKDYRLAVLVHLLFRCVRVGDAVKHLTIKNLYYSDGSPRDILDYIEEKSGKRRIINLSGAHFHECLLSYYPVISNKRDDENLFYSKRKTPITPRGVNDRLCKYVGKWELEQLSAHSFRKGGARYMWETGTRIEVIRDMLNHHDTKITERYISITAEDVAKAMECFKY